MMNGSNGVNGAMRVGRQSTSKPTELQRLKVEVETLRARSDSFAGRVIEKIESEHRTEVEHLKIRIQMLESDLALQKQQNRAADLDLAVIGIVALKKQLAEKDRILESVGATLRGLINMHLGGSA